MSDIMPVGSSVDVISTSLTNCARCRGDHKSLEFRRFIRYVIADSDGTVWSWWALCPNTGEPILMKIIDELVL